MDWAGEGSRSLLRQRDASTRTPPMTTCNTSFDSRVCVSSERRLGRETGEQRAAHAKFEFHVFGSLRPLFVALVGHLLLERGCFQIVCALICAPMLLLCLPGRSATAQAPRIIFPRSQGVSRMSRDALANQEPVVARACSLAESSASSRAAQAAAVFALHSCMLALDMAIRLVSHTT